MNFYFDNANSDELMRKINLRELSKMAIQWEHPCVAIKDIFSNFQKYNRNLLNFPKEFRENFAVSIMAMVLSEDTKKDWWYFRPQKETPDGIVITLDQRGEESWGVVREIEVVEHRNSEKSIFDRIRDKLNESYLSETVVLCYVLEQGQHNFSQISQMLMNTDTKLKHAFIAYWGTQLKENQVLSENDFFQFTLVQLIPKFFSLSVDIREALNGYEKKYEEGSELRLIEGNTIYRGTRNPIFIKR